jgi:hypothetical protein
VKSGLKSTIYFNIFLTLYLPCVCLPALSRSPVNTGFPTNIGHTNIIGLKRASFFFIHPSLAGSKATYAGLYALSPSPSQREVHILKRHPYSLRQISSMVYNKLLSPDHRSCPEGTGSMYPDIHLRY